MIPFEVWPAQEQILTTVHTNRLTLILKARQLGISWVLCGYVLWLCSLTPNQPVLLFSQGQLEANQLIERISLMYHQHQDASWLSPLVVDNTAELGWANGSSVLSLAATKRAGRSFTAALVILDEFAFMADGQATLDAVKPTVDAAGAQLVVLSSGDGPNSDYHRMWLAAKAGTNGYTSVFLPWQARPDRGPTFREERIVEAGNDRARVVREYPENDLEAFIAATGLVYGDQWSDGPPDGNVTEEAEYVPDTGTLYWALDDGYAGEYDAERHAFTASSHPRVTLWVQVKPDGTIDVFDELYAIEQVTESYLADALAHGGYPRPRIAVCDSSAAELRKRLTDLRIPTMGGTHTVDEGIKFVRGWLAPDRNGKRRIRVHPRCVHLRTELASYRYNPKGELVKSFDHGPDALRYLVWKLRHTK